jgi:hypothetical protein
VHLVTSQDVIAEAIEKIPTDDLDVTAIAWCDLHNRITRETGLSEEAARQMMKKECLIWIEKMAPVRGMLSGKVMPLPIHRQD